MEPHVKTHQQEQDDGVSSKPITLSKYSNRVELKTLLERSDGGARLAGKRVVIGGWIKSSRAVKKDSPPPPVVTVASPSSGGDQAHTTANTEIIQSKMNILRSFFDEMPMRLIARVVLKRVEFFIPSQVVVDSALSTVPATQLMALGTCIVAEGVLRLPLAASSAKHVIELEAEKLLHVGTVDPERYPLLKKQLPLAYA